MPERATPKRPARTASRPAEAPALRGRGVETRAHLTEAALDHVWDVGYGVATIADIAERARVPRGSVFYYFPTKDDIVVAAIESYVAQAHARRVEKLLGPWRADQSAGSRFQSYFRSRLEARRKTGFRRGCLLGNLAGEIGGQDLPLVAQAVQAGLHAFETDILNFLAASSRAGQIERGAELPALAATIVNGWEGALLQMKLRRSPQPLEHFMTSFEGVFRVGRGRGK